MLVLCVCDVCAVQAYKDALDAEEASRAALQEKLKLFEAELSGEFIPGIATGGQHVASLPSVVGDVDVALDAADRGFRSLDEVTECACDVIRPVIVYVRVSGCRSRTRRGARSWRHSRWARRVASVCRCRRRWR